MHTVYRVSACHVHYISTQFARRSCDACSFSACAEFAKWDSHQRALDDKSRTGRRTILCFFLVDPTLRVRSKATVPRRTTNVLGWLAPCAITVDVISVILQKEHDPQPERRFVSEIRRAIEDQMTLAFYERSCSSPSCASRNTKYLGSFAN